MRNLSLALLIGLLSANVNAEHRECFDAMPGEERTRIDDPNNIKITRVKIGRQEQYAYIATEYLGAGNLQGEVYLKIQNQYCASGLLGPVTAFRTEKSNSTEFWPLVVESRSGPAHFLRIFKYDKKLLYYLIFSCKEKRSNSKWVACSEAEESK